MDDAKAAQTLSPPDDWVDKHGDYLYRCALVRLRDPSAAQDLVQETFLAALKGKDSFSGRSSERTWLVGILKHKVVDHFRRSSRETSVEDLEDQAEPNEEMMTLGFWSWPRPGRWGYTPPEHAESDAFWKVFRECLAGIPPRLASAFAMREVDEQSSDAICKELSITPTNLWVMLHRARSRLRRCLELKWLDGAWKGKRP